MRCIAALRQSVVVATSPLCLPTLRWKLVRKVVLFTFQRNLHVRAELMYLKQVMCLSDSLFRRWKIWEWLLSWIRKETKLHVQLFGLYSSPAEYSTMGHIVLDLTSLTYQPKLRERSAHPKRHVTCEIWGIFTRNTTRCPLRSLRRGQLIGTFLEGFMIFTCMWWWHVHSAIRHSRHLTDHAWADCELKNLVILSSWTMDQQKIGGKTFGFLIIWMERQHIWQHISVRVPLHQKSF